MKFSAATLTALLVSMATSTLACQSWSLSNLYGDQLVAHKWTLEELRAAAAANPENAYKFKDSYANRVAYCCPLSTAKRIDGTVNWECCVGKHEFPKMSGQNAFTKHLYKASKTVPHIPLWHCPDPALESKRPAEY